MTSYLSMLDYCVKVEAMLAVSYLERFTDTLTINSTLERLLEESLLGLTLIPIP